ncbi:sensor histidine kinase [Flexibacter flexilis]|nr:sensor histidine kinase [Flexibacter flexilis]
MNILCQKSFAMFDVQQYRAADSLMQPLISSHYQYLDDENKAKILTQESYLLYQKKQYKQAEQKYLQTLPLLRQSNPCDLPLIYGKLIGLYSQTNHIPNMYKVYEKGMHYADSCNILKYKVYLNLIMYRELEVHKKYAEAFYYIKLYDSFFYIYDERGYQHQIKELNQSNEIERKDVEIATQEKQQKYLLTIVLILVSAILIFIWLYLKLKQQHRIIQQQQKVNEQVISIISHDIKEPLLAVKLLLKKLNIQDKIMVQVSQSLEQQISSVNHILTSLLEIRKNNTQNTATLWPILNNVIKDLDTKIQNKELTIVNEITEATQVPISPEKLRIILYNLLGNAIKYSHHQGQIHLFNTAQGFAIQDFGIGIPAQKLNTLLKDAVVSGKGTAQEEGNGMGLYIMGQITKQSKIEIRFISEEGKGTTVHIIY